MEKEVHVSVTDKKAIYINDIRITNRDTKWGVHNSIEEFKCPRDKVIFELIARGYKNLLPLIEDEMYVKQLKDFNEVED